MNKTACFLAGILLVFLAGSVRDSQNVVVTTFQNQWVVIESCTSADDETTALDVDERTFQTVLAAIVAEGDRTDKNGEIEWYIVPPTWNNIRFTAMGITDNGTYTVDVFAGTLPPGVYNTDTLTEANAKTQDCNLTHIGTLAFVIGKQVSTTSTYELADAVTVTTKDATKSWTSASNAAEDTAEAVIDLQGANVLVIVPTTCSANSKLLIKGY